jgi:hypothetical protein
LMLPLLRFRDLRLRQQINSPVEPRPFCAHGGAGLGPVLRLAPPPTPLDMRRCFSVLLY